MLLIIDVSEWCMWTESTSLKTTIVFSQSEVKPNSVSNDCFFPKLHYGIQCRTPHKIKTN